MGPAVSKAVLCQSNMTALSREPTLFILGYEYCSAITSSAKHLTALYRDATLLTPPYWGGASFESGFDRLLGEEVRAVFGRRELTRLFQKRHRGAHTK